MEAAKSKAAQKEYEVREEAPLLCPVTCGKAPYLLEKKKILNKTLPLAHSRSNIQGSVRGSSNARGDCIDFKSTIVYQRNGARGLTCRQSEQVMLKRDGAVGI